MIADFDSLLAHLGTGRWTAVIFIVACYREFLGPGQVLTGGYMAPQINYTCRAPEGALANYSDKCTYQMMSNSTGKIETHQCDSWDFDNSTWTSTINSEFNLGCGASYLAASFSSIYMMGRGIGAVLNSLLCDEYGRKTMLCIGMSIYFLNIIIYWLPTITSILVVRFIIGMGYAIVYDATTILSLEIVVPRLRPAICYIVWIPWVFGMMALGGIGYMIRDWRTLQIVVSLPYLLIIPAFWLLDESPRWLIVKGKRKNAVKLLRKAARWQNVDLPPDAELVPIMDEIKSQDNKEDGNSQLSKLERVRAFFERIFNLFRTPHLRTLTLVSYFNHMVFSLLYFGLALNTVDYSSDPFIYMVLGGLMELPSCTIVVPIITKYGRKIPGMLFFLATGVCLLALPFISKDLQWLSMTLALSAKGLVAMAWAAFALQCSELFPTEIRLLGMGTSGIMTSVGSSLSAYINDLLTPVASWAPSVLFGLSAIFATLAMNQLPETKDMPLPDTIHDLENTEFSNIKCVSRGSMVEK